MLFSTNFAYEFDIYGFRPKQKTIHPIIHLLNHCAKSTSKQDPEYTLSIICDLSKAFDVINHDILLTKMNSFGIRGIVGDWFRSYLSDRRQYVELDNNKSATVPIKSSDVYIRYPVVCHLC